VREFDSGTVLVSVAGVDHGVVEQVKPSSTLTPEQAAADAFGRNTVDFKAQALDTGADLISDELLARFERLVIGRGGGERLHRLFRRGFVFSHRDFDKILTSLEQRKPVYLLHSCRGHPTVDKNGSQAMHLGNFVPLQITKWMQDALGLPVVIQLHDDENYLKEGQWDDDSKSDNMELLKSVITEQVRHIVACGFDKAKTFIFSNLEYTGHMYPNVVRLWKSITYETAAPIFGFKGDTNVGLCGFPAVQAAAAFASSFLVPLAGHDDVSCLVTCTIDHDVYFRIAREVAPRLVPCGYPLEGKPAMLISKFTPGLQGVSSGMSASEVNSAINLTDTAAEIETKLSKYAFSGGQVLSVDQRKLGGNLSIDLAFQFLTIFLDDDVELETVAREYGTGQGDSFWSSGQVKKKAVSVLQKVISEHQDNLTRVTKEQTREWMAVRPLQF